ncbi:hypothetical protein O4H32_14205 [Castellaniella denitrificans]|uniref:Uncharacterized protein n=2 Tax=Castellaniella denitrificans TaxID=56119 RepID=A0ABT4M700_9BURK|nr:hypothetical protein [Castellaniella denitrificans]
MMDLLRSGPADLSRAMVRDVLEAIHKYDGTVPFALAVGVLEMCKAQLIEDAAVEDEDD